MPKPDTPLPPLLTRANIALFRGERAETLRLLTQYENERPAADDPYQSMVLWLRAQAQPDHETRIALLYDLIGRFSFEDEYAAMARDYLEAEEQYALPERSGRRGLWIGGSVVLLAAVLLGGFLLGGRGRGTDPAPTEVLQEPTPTATAVLPDASVPLVESAFTLRYESGILGLTAFEDNSVRVVGADGGQVTPVAGARFLALEAIFECRRGICNTPPEAIINLVTDNGEVIAIREGVSIAGGDVMAPVALGRSTRGWLVFELPSLSRIAALQVFPVLAEENAPPLTVDLSGL
jgi:hypothetical protein